MSPSTDDELIAINRKLRWLTAGVFLAALGVFFSVAVLFGYIVDFHAGEGLLIGGACGSGVIVGFLFGWLARRAAGPLI
jgi:hypothetical protein